MTHHDEIGWEKRYWEKYGRLATHPLANGLKDFIQQEISKAIEAERARVVEMIDSKIQEAQERYNEFTPNLKMAEESNAEAYVIAILKELKSRLTK